MTAQSPLIEPPPVSVSDSLLLAIFLAAVFHVIIIFSVNFTVSLPKKINKSIEITITQTVAEKAPEKAHYLAQDNQLGAGEAFKKPEPPKQQLPSEGKTKKRTLKKNDERSKKVHAKKLITQKQSEVKVNTADEAETMVDKSRPKLSPDALVKQVAKLGANIRYSQPSAEKNRIKFVNQVSTHKYSASQYILDWQRKVERLGKLNISEAISKRTFDGFIVMDVGIKRDGSVYSMRISRSSGIKAIDDAAKRIVKMGAPYSPLPKELWKELDVLVINRTWRWNEKME
jgi:protein TonB